MGLGSVPVSPLDLASAYATLAAGGMYSEPMAIRRVVLANGREDQDAGWGRPKRRRAISEGTAAIVTRILEQNMQSGTGTRAAFGRPAAGKTGTNEEHKDAWFAGYTPDLATTVWVGYTREEIPMESVHGIAVAGGTLPGRDLAALHGAGARERRADGVRRARGLAASGSRSRAASTR